jgi:hypothetical protein
MNDERLRQLYMQGLAARERKDARAGAPCAVAPDDLLALARGELGEERRLELLDRVMVNERCRQELDLLRAVVAAEREALAAESDGPPAEEDPESAGEPAPAPTAAPALRVIRGGALPPQTPQARVAESAPRRAWWRHGGLTAAIAASLLLAVGVSQFLRGGRGGVEPTRGAGDAVAVLAPGEVVEAGAPVTFAWRPVPGATHYQFELADADGNAGYQTIIRDTTTTLPATVTLRAGVQYRWIVRATDDAGAPRGTAVRRLAVRGR